MNFVCALLAVASTGLTPSECVSAIRADVATVPPTVAPYIRYLTFGEFDKAIRTEKVQVLSGHVNHLSTQQGIETGYVLPNCDNAVLRINVLDYGWTPELWERLVDVEPYFTVKVEEDWPGGVWPGDGKNYPGPGKAGNFRWKRPTLSHVLSEGPTGKDDLIAIVAATQSRLPMVRGDWFLNQSAIQHLRRVGYYDWLGIKTVVDVDRLVGFDAKLAKASGRIDREAVSESGVALQARAIDRRQGFRPKWSSHDFELALDRKDPTRVIGQDIENEQDATEIFFGLLNELWGTAIFNGKAVRLDFAAPEIASDKRSKSNDTRVHVGASCLRCHAVGGLQPIDEWWHGNPLKFTDEAKAREFREQYLSDLKHFIERDRSVYEHAVEQATRTVKFGADGKPILVKGWTSKEWSGKFAAEWERYEDASVDLEWAARDLHVPPAKLVEMVKKARDAELVIRQQRLIGNTLSIEVVPAVDPVVARIADGKRVGIRQWEHAFPSAAFTVRGVVP